MIKEFKKWCGRHRRELDQLLSKETVDVVWAFAISGLMGHIAFVLLGKTLGWIALATGFTVFKFSWARFDQWADNLLEEVSE